MLRATRRELTRAYRHHRNYCTDLTVVAYRLIALYCIECGLKALILQQRRVESTDELPPEAEIGHDLIAGLRLLRAPVALFKIRDLPVFTRHDRDPQDRVVVKDLHQTLRYGISTTLEPAVSTEIANIVAWLEKRFNEDN